MERRSLLFRKDKDDSPDTCEKRGRSQKTRRAGSSDTKAVASLREAERMTVCQIRWSDDSLSPQGRMMFFDSMLSFDPIQSVYPPFCIRKGYLGRVYISIVE